MARYSVTPNMLVVPPQLLLYLAVAQEEKIVFNTAGPAGPAQPAGPPYWCSRRIGNVSPYRLPPYSGPNALTYPVDEAIQPHQGLENSQN